MNRWLLPEGIEEILSKQALATESLRRQLLDLFDSWGYDLVIPPAIEFTDSLLTGLGADLNRCSRTQCIRRFSKKNGSGVAQSIHTLARSSGVYACHLW